MDAERAHGFRYSQRAYLLQPRRAGIGTHLVDPIAFGQPADLSSLGDAFADAEWVIHAANQDLPCLYEVGLVPRTLFDTELAARLLGYPRVALATMIEELLGLRLLKRALGIRLVTQTTAYRMADLRRPGRRAVDRPAEQARGSAARDREVAMGGTGVCGTGRRCWISPEPRRDPWRRTSGIHHVHSRRGLAYVAELWFARDAIALIWTGLRARSCRIWLSLSWLRISTRTEPRCARFPRSLAAKPGGPNQLGWRRSTPQHSCPRMRFHPCTFPTTGHRSPDCGLRRILAQLPGWRLPEQRC